MRDWLWMPSEEEKPLAFIYLKQLVQQLDLAQNQLPAKPAFSWGPSEGPGSGLDLLRKPSLH